MKVVKIAGLCLLALLLVFGATIGYQVLSGIKEAQTLAAEDIEFPNLADVPDGIWKGEVEWGILVVEVEVTVEAGIIAAIDVLRHDNGRGSKAEGIVDDILSAQSPVDSISGATLSSRAILRAVANALNAPLNSGK